MKRWWSLGAVLLMACAPPVREVKTAAEYENQDEADKPQAPRQRVLPPRPHEPAEAEPQPEEPAEPSPPAVERKLPELEPFYAALDALRANQRDEHVRVMWLGDSHTAADFMTHPIRQHLARLGGDGGPGFVRLGHKGYRHGAVRLADHGKWRRAPILPAQRTRVLDGVFGYGGIRTLPAAAAGVSAELREKSSAPITWRLSYRLLHGARLEARLGEERTRISADEDTALAGQIESREFSGVGTDVFSVHHVAGDPQVFGVFGEFETPGVVLDTVGINGARAATALAWEPEQFVDQVKLRSPDLLVLAFGTNEVFDQTGTYRYLEHNKRLVELARQARPDMPCWIVGPPDSATRDGNSKARVAEVTAVQKEAAEALGCAFTSIFELMGGEGSFTRWAKARPAKARGDRVHFSILGYQTIGELLAAALVEGSALEERQPDQSAGAASPEEASSTLNAR